MGKRVLILVVAACALLAVAMVAGATPTKDTNPSLAGTAQVGATLTLTQGTYTASGTDPVVRAESWQRCNNAGGGGCDALSPQPSGLSYQLQGADLGKFIRVTETASDGSGDPVVTDTNSIGPIAAAPQAPAKTTDPVVSAPDLVFDQTPPSVTVQPGAWMGNPTPNVVDHWQRCDTAGGGCADIGPTGGAYQLQAADVGKFLRVRETATNGVAPDGQTFSNVVGPVTQPLAPANPPVLDNPNPVVPQVLTTTTGTYTGFPQPTSYAYAWQRCNDNAGGGCVPVGGNSPSYTTVLHQDAGKFIRVQVTASNNQSTAASAPAQTAQPIRQAPVNTALPTLNNTAPALASAVAGLPAPLPVTIGINQPPGTWVGFPTAIVFQYQWQRCATTNTASCQDIQGATQQTYTLQQLDVGQFLRARVTADNTVAPPAGAPPNFVFTALTEAVRQAPSNTGANGMQAPFLTVPGGLPVRGQPITGSAGIWFAFPTPPALGFVHQWQRCNAQGNTSSCVDVGTPIQVTPQTTQPFTQTGTSQYAITDADLGSTYRLKVSMNNGVGSPVIQFSPVSQPARGAPVNLAGSAPAVSDTGTPVGTADGQPNRGETLRATSGLWTGFWASDQPPLAITHTWQRCPASGAVSGCVDLAAPVPTPLSSVAPPPSPVITCTGPGATTPPAGTGPCNSSSVFLLTDADLGSRIRVVVTAQNPGGTVTVATPMTPVILGPPIITQTGGQPDPDALPKITGSAQQGLTLVGSSGSWSAFPRDNLTFTYEWLRCANGALDSCSPVGGGSRDTYLLGPSDVGQLIRVRVTAKNGVLPDGVAVSGPTAAVIAPSGGTGGPGADLILQLSTATSGADVDYTLTIRNIGTGGADGVSVKATLAPQLTIVSATASAGSCIAGVTCSLGSLPAGGMARVMIATRATASGTVPFSATVSSATVDVNPTNNTVSGSTQVTVTSPRAPSSTPGPGGGPGGPNETPINGSSNVAEVTAKLLAKKVGATWVVDTKFSLVSGKAKLLLTVTPNGSSKRLAFLKGSRLGSTFAKKTQKTLSLNAPKPATFPVRIVMSAKGFSKTKIYVIRIKATAPNGLSSNLDIGFSGSRVLGRSTVVAKIRAQRVGSTWVLKTTSPLVPAKGKLQVWVTPNGSMGNALTLLKGSRSGSVVAGGKQKQLSVQVAKAARLPVSVVLPVRGLSAKKTYVLRMRTIGASGPLAQVDLGFRTAAPPVAARAAAR